MRNTLLLVIACIGSQLGAAVCASAQMSIPILPDAEQKKVDPAVKVPVYEVASVKVHKSDDRMMRIQTKDDGFSATNLPLISLMAFAYGTRQDLISGASGPVNSARFDIEAKLAGSDIEAVKKLNQEQRRGMLKKVLEERFDLKLHTETKTLPVYELSVAKGGVKMQVAVAPPPNPDGKLPEAPKGFGSISMSPGEVHGKGLPMMSVTGQLANILQRTVIDKTGLQGRYEFDLKWTPEQLAGSRSDNGTEENDLSIFTAVQEQLGLKLQPAKGPVETLVIDHAGMPSEN